MKRRISKMKKRIVALIMATVVGITSIPMADYMEVKAEEIAQEYVVMAEDASAYEDVVENYEGAVAATQEVIGEEVQIQESLEDENMTVLELTENEAEKLAKDEDILFVEENIIFEASNNAVEKKLELKRIREENETVVDAKQQWNIDAIHANEQEYMEGKDRIKVAVMDTGVTVIEDIDVAGRVNLIEEEEEVHPLYEDVSGHGTAVASIIAAKENGIGITGVNPQVELYSVKVLDDRKQATLSRVIEGICWCIENDIDIINMSFGTTVKSEILEQVVKKADAAGILMIAAAGNNGSSEGKSTVEYPAAYEEVIAVGATTPEGTVSQKSSVGEEIELVAPGEDVPATGYFGEVIRTE